MYYVVRTVAGRKRKDSVESVTSYRQNNRQMSFGQKTRKENHSTRAQSEERLHARPERV